MTNYRTGHLAEKYACEYLKMSRYKIIETNWKTRFCEIDIVALRRRTIYFIEVKYRRTAQQGTGLDYITASKLKRMKFAAEMWISQNNWNKNYRLSALELGGSNYEVSNFLPVLE